VKRKKVPRRLRRERKTTLAQARRKLWEKFSSYVKERDGPTCFSCGAQNLTGSNWHAGHLYRSAGHPLTRYDPRNVHSQCGACNIWRTGNTAAYAARFLDRYGIAEFNRLDRLSRVQHQWRAPELRELLARLERDPADYECYYAEVYALGLGVMGT
jgi:5-methylcytosine-specific restriction endonuclease McrA